MDTVNLDPVSFDELGDGRVIVEFVIRARGQASGIEAAQPAVAIATAADGKLTRLEFFTDLERARAAAGSPPRLSAPSRRIAGSPPASIA